MRPAARKEETNRTHPYPMSRITLLLLSFLSLAPLLRTTAQSVPRTLRGVVVDSAERTPLVGAAVLVVSPRDTVHVISDSRGRFSVPRLRDTSVLVSVSYLGYRNVRFRTEPTGKDDTIALGKIPLHMKEIVVQGMRPLMGESGDTIVYHPENIKVLPGDEALQIVTRLPGMDVSDDKITFMGKTVERTYVDGKPLFGEDARTALDYLEAREVVDIQVYEEMPEEEKIKGEKNGKKRTVMNLITRNKPQKSINVELLGSLGADIDPDADGNHRLRYSAGGAYNYFSERKSYSVRANSNNNNQGGFRMRGLLGGYGGSQGDRRNTSAGANLHRKFGEHGTLFANYGYSNNHARTRTRSEQIYFPTQDYTSRHYRDTSRNASLTVSHTAGLVLRYNPKNDYLFFSPHISFTQGRTDSYRGASNELDGETLNRTSTYSRYRNTGHNVSGNLSWGHSFKNHPRRSFNLSVHGQTSRNDNEGVQIDSLASDLNRTYLLSTAGGWSHGAGLNAFYAEPIGESNSLSARYGLSYDKSKSERIAVDRYTGQIDTALTYEYSRDYTTQSCGLGFNRNTESLSLSVGAGYQSARLNKDEAFPDMRRDRHVFRSFQPSVSVNYSVRNSMHLSANYNTSAGQPSIEQLRNELNTQNPLALTGGNSDLRQSYTHSVWISFYKTDTKTSRSFGLSAGGSIVSRSITVKQVFFTEDTPLEAYNGYVAPKGSTLTVPVNVNGGGNANLSGNFSTPIQKLGLTFNAGGGLAYNRSPTYIGEALDYNNSLSPNVSLGFFSNKSTVYQFSLSSRTAYNHTSNSLKDNNNTLTQSVGTNVTVNFLKHMYFNTHYRYYFYHNFSIRSNDVSTHTWSLALGCKLLKKRQLDVGFQIYDILNSTQNFASTMMADYVSNSWTQNFGRYFSFAVGYKFNTTGWLRSKN